MIRRQFLRNSLGTVAAAAGIHALSSCGGAKNSGGRGQITLGSYADPALDILKDVLLPEFEKATGIRTEWVEADFSGWLQKALNDGQTKAGAFDIYVMDDLWVPRFAGAGYLANLDELGFQTDQDFVPSALDLGYWPPVEALEFYLRLLAYAPPGVAEFDSDQEGETLLQGNAFAATMWTGWCRQTDDPARSRVVNKISFDVPPKQVKQVAKLGLFMAGIASSAPNRAGALEFLKWFSSSATQLRFARAGGTPFKMSALQDGEARGRSRWLDSTAKALAIGVPSPRTSDWSKVEDILGTELNRALLEKGKAKQHLDAAAAEATAFLKSAGYPVG